MQLAADISLVAVLAKVVLLAIAGGGACVLFRSAHVDRTPRLAAARDARRPAYVSPHAKPLPQAVTAIRLAPGAEIDRLAAVLDRARAQVQAINGATTTAANQIAGAEAALNRLIADLSRVMPEVIAPTVIPRRELAVVVEAAATARAA